MSNEYSPLFQLGPDATPYRKLTSEGVRIEKALGREFLVVEPSALTALAEQALIDINHLLRPGHLAQLAKILDDPEATANDKFVAYDLLKNANIAAGGILPMCQDTGTAIVVAKKGRHVFTEGGDEAAIASGIAAPTQEEPALQPGCAALDVRGEEHRRQSARADRHLRRGRGRLQVPVHGQGRRLGQQDLSLSGDAFDPDARSLIAFLKEKILTLGTSACPPYHLAIVIGGTSAEQTLKTVKLASARYLDALPTSGAPDGRAFRDLALEEEMHKLTQQLGVGAQFGGKYFCHDVRVIRLPRHGASLPIGLGVSCSADRQALGKITRDGVFLEELEHDPARFLPSVDEASSAARWSGSTFRSRCGRFWPNSASTRSRRGSR